MPDDLARLENKIINARNNFGINVVASSGNDGNTSAVNYPARFPASFAVGGTDRGGAFCSFSNRGVGLDISALGCDTYATAFDGRIGAFEGTSFAAPTVAAVLVALRSYRPDLTADQAEQLLLSTARQTSAGPVLGRRGGVPRPRVSGRWWMPIRRRSRRTAVPPPLVAVMSSSAWRSRRLRRCRTTGPRSLSCVRRATGGAHCVWM